MGYNLTIGEFYADIEHEERWTRPSAERMDGTNIGAPVASSGDPNDRGNSISPGYIGWFDFTKRHDLLEVFYAGRRDCPQGDWPHRGILYEHAGAVALLEDHYEAFVAARDRYKISAEDPEGWDKKRLDWLVFWSRWALDNCRYPTFANS